MYISRYTSLNIAPILIRAVRSQKQNLKYTLRYMGPAPFMKQMEKEAEAKIKDKIKPRVAMTKIVQVKDTSPRSRKVDRLTSAQTCRQEVL